MDNRFNVIVKGIILQNKRILLLKRSDTDDVSPGSWEFVGGKMDAGESLEEALFREIREEVGLEVSIKRLLYATTFKTDPHRQVVLLTYLCQSPTANVTLSYEHSDYLWATKNEMKEMIHPDILGDLERYHILSIEELNQKGS